MKKLVRMNLLPVLMVLFVVYFIIILMFAFAVFFLGKLALLDDDDDTINIDLVKPACLGGIGDKEPTWYQVRN